MSSDGTVVVGWSETGSRNIAFRWTKESGTIPLDTSVTTSIVTTSIARAVSTGGAYIVGDMSEIPNVREAERAFIWDEDNGMRDLNQVLATEFDLQEKLAGWTLQVATSITPDGTVLAGRGTDPSGRDDRSWIVDLAAIEGDFNRDRSSDATDADLITSRINAGSDNLRLDYDRNGTVDLDDHRFWVEQVANSWFGDANLDSQFSSSDLVDVFQIGKYETGESALWSEGDWNADGLFSTSDLVTAFQEGGYDQGPRAIQAVPEPSTVLLISMALIGLATTRRRIDSASTASFSAPVSARRRHRPTCFWLNT